MAAEVTIRRAVPSDVPRLSELARRTWLDAFGDGVRQADALAELDQTRSEAYFADALQEQTILVAEEEGSLLGYVQFGDVDIPGVEAQPCDRELQRLYVETSLQGSGLGRRLMDAALRHPRLADAGCIYLRVWESNDRAVRLYESVGFRRVTTTTFTVGSDAMLDMVMCLERGRLRERAEGASRPG